MVNNAGMSMRDEFRVLDLSLCEKIMDLNLMSQIAVTKAVLPQMTQRRSGHIVNVVSGSGKVGLPMRTLYAASKFALSGFGKALRAELSEDNIQVTQFYPGYIRTNISKNAMTADGSAFGKTDSNIAKGMSVKLCSEQMLKGLSLGYQEMMIGDFLTHLIPFLAPVAPLIDRIMLLYRRKQLKAKQGAKSD